MARKNISTGVDNAAAVVDLDDDDEIVKTVLTETRVGRRKRLSEPPALAGGTDAEIEQDDDNAIDAELLDDDEPEYSENSLAALIYDEDSENRVDNKFCSVAVRRNPDSMNDKFRNPCGAVTNYPPLRNIELTADRMDIEDKVRAENGGGHYFFQIHLNGRLGPSWKATLSDDPRTLAAASSAVAATQPAALNTPSPVAVDPLDALIENLDKFAKLKTVFGGGEKTEKEIRMEYEIAELRREIEAAKNAPAERKSERLTLFEAALNAGAGNPLQSKILDNLFPSEEKEPRHWIADTLDVALQHKEEILAIAGPLFMSLLGGGQPQQMPPPGMMPQQIPPPPAFPAPPPMQFAPRTPEPEPLNHEPQQFEAVSVLIDGDHLQIPHYSADDLPEGLVAVRGDVGDGEKSIIDELTPKPGVDIRHDDDPTPLPKRIRHAKFKKDYADNSNAIDAEDENDDAAAKP